MKITEDGKVLVVAKVDTMASGRRLEADKQSEISIEDAEALFGLGEIRYVEENEEENNNSEGSEEADNTENNDSSENQNSEDSSTEKNEESENSESDKTENETPAGSPISTDLTAEGGKKASKKGKKKKKK